METFGLGTLSALIVGVIVGWFGHVLAGRRSKADRRVLDETDQIERCMDVFSARVKYVIAYHRKAPQYGQIKEEYLGLKRIYRWADPEVVLHGTPEWETYITAEQTAMRDKDIVPVEERVKSINAVSYLLLDALAKRRENALN